MGKKIIALTIFILYADLLFAQDENIRFLDAFRIHEEAVNPSSGIINSYNDIEGSPYLFPDYRNADIYMKDSLHYHGKIRYDLYADEMEYQVKGKTFWIGPKDNIKKIMLDGRPFLYLKNKDFKKGGYYELLVNGPCQLLVRHLITFHEAQGAKPYQDPTPARFGQKHDLYYLKRAGQSLFLIKNKKSISNYLNDKGTKISSFIKKNHVSPARVADLKKLIEYYNSLPQ